MKIPGLVKKNKWLFIAAKFLLACSVMILVVRAVEFERIAETLQNPQYPHRIWLAWFLLIPNLMIQWYRWHFLLRQIRPGLPVMESVQSFFGGQVVGFITPGRIGEIGRTLFLEKTDRIQSIGMVFIDKFYAFAVIVIAGIWGFVVILGGMFDYHVFVLIPMLVIALSVSLLLLILSLRPEIIRGFLYHLSVILPVRDRMKEVIHCMDRMERGQAHRFFWMTVLFYISFIVQFCLLANAFEEIALWKSISATSATMFAKTLLPVSVGDLGIREGASVFFFMKMGVGKVAAFNGSFLLFIINILFPTLIGICFLPKMSLRSKAD